MTDVNRREFTKGVTLAGLGAGFGSFADFAQAQELSANEHFFFVIELRGGLQWMIATDGRDPDKLPLDKPRICRSLKITDTPLTPEEYQAIVEGEFYRTGSQHGKFILLPYVGDDLKACYTKGKTTSGSDYSLGWCANALKPYVNDIAVLRGIAMQADFHGIANASGEIFSGIPSPESPHVASILSTLLQQKVGVTKLLDNLVFENATYSPGNSPLAKAPVRLDAESLGYIVGNADTAGPEAAEQRFAKARELSDALSKSPGLSDLHKKTFLSYIGAMKEAPVIRKMLLDLKADLGAVDASLDLAVQLRTSWTLMKAGLTRVVTLCLGAPNGKNQVDGFGLFDAHQGVYHLSEENTGTVNTQRHHLNVEKTMGVIADFVKQLKATKYGNTSKTWLDMATVVIGTEFARPSNFMGNEASGSAGGTAFGNGHYNFNNNYIMFGKGIRGGSWIGKNDEITQMGYKVDMTSVGGDAAAMKLEPHPMTFNPETEGASEAEGEGTFSPAGVDFASDQRPLMANDAVRTILGAAGFDNRFAEAYTDERLKNAKSLKPVLKG